MRRRSEPKRASPDPRQAGGQSNQGLLWFRKTLSAAQTSFAFGADMLPWHGMAALQVRLKVGPASWITQQSVKATWHKRHEEVPSQVPPNIFRTQQRAQIGSLF